MAWCCRLSCSTMPARPRSWSMARSLPGPIHFSCSVPRRLQVPLVALATVATIIASQSIISGAFSMTRQAIQLGLVPAAAHRADVGRRLRPDLCRVRELGSDGRLRSSSPSGFRSSDNLAAAFGIAVSMTMLLTSMLMFVTMREVWGWSLPLSLAVAGLFVIVDLSFVCANLMKVFDGGWFPLVVAALVFFLMFDVAARPRRTDAQA